MRNQVRHSPPLPQLGHRNLMARHRRGTARLGLRSTSVISLPERISLTVEGPALEVSLTCSIVNKSRDLRSKPVQAGSLRPAYYRTKNKLPRSGNQLTYPASDQEAMTSCSQLC
jgi:hypothetical protein